MTITRKLKISLDPTIIDPVLINDTNKEEFLFRLKSFDEKLTAMQDSIRELEWDNTQDLIFKTMHTLLWDYVKNSINSSTRFSMWGSMKHTMQEPIRKTLFDSIIHSNWHTMVTPMWDSVRDSVIDSIRDSVWNSMPPSINKSIRDSVWDSVNDSITDSLWASICSKFSASEYAELFNKENSQRELIRFKSRHELCEEYNWFSERGLFPHRSLIKGDIFVASWKTPKKIQKISIL